MENWLWLKAISLSWHLIYSSTMNHAWSIIHLGVNFLEFQLFSVSIVKNFNYEGITRSIPFARLSRRMSNITDTHQLTWTETQWVTLFKDSSYPTARLAIVLFAWHQIVFIGRYIPYVICDHISFLRKYRIQKEKIVTNEQWWMCIKQVLMEQVSLQLPMMMGFKPMAEQFGMEFLTVPLPSWSEIIKATIFFLIVEDCYQYFVHRAMHWGPLYKHIHKIHHKFAAPFGICAEYAHPLETLVLGLGFFIGPMIWTLYRGMHIFTMAAWLAVRLIQTVDAHSGYDFPWSLHHFIPFWAGAEFHDYHHQAFVGNYASSFRFWDWLFGTSKAFNQWKAKKALGMNGDAALKELDSKVKSE